MSRSGILSPDEFLTFVQNGTRNTYNAQYNVEQDTRHEAITGARN